MVDFKKVLQGFICIFKIVSLKSEYVQYKAYEYNENNVDFYHYDNTKMTFEASQNPYEEYQSTNLDWCRLKCAMDQPKCRNVVFDWHYNGMRCKLYDVDGTVVSGGGNDKLFTINMREDVFLLPSGYCSNLAYLNLCGNCACIDLKGSNKSPYYCDCRNAVGVKISCEHVRQEDSNPVTGLYRIKPDNEDDAFDVYCVFRAGSKAMMRFIRRVDKDKHYISTSLNYYRTNNDKLWEDSVLGLKYVRTLNEVFGDFDLVVETYDPYGNFYRSTYTGFKIGKGTDFKFDVDDKGNDGSQLLSSRNRKFESHNNFHGKSNYWWGNLWNPLGYVSYATFRLHSDNLRDQQMIFYIRHR